MTMCNMHVTAGTGKRTPPKWITCAFLPERARGMAGLAVMEQAEGWQVQTQASR